MQNLSNENKSFPVVSFYQNIKQTTPSGFIPITDAYRLFKTTAQDTTAKIQRDFADAIQNGFTKEKKSEYQDEKKRLLASVCFFGNVDRNAKDQEDFVPSGRINFDIDENSKEELDELFLSMSKIVYVEAAGRSISGIFNGSMWVTVRVEMPEKGKRLSSRFRDLLGLIGNESYYKVCEVLCQAYHGFFSSYFQKINIKIGQAGKDLKRSRFISYDPGLYLNLNAEVYSLEELEYFLENQLEKEKKRRETDDEITAFNQYEIEHTEDAFLYAERFAAARGTTFEKGMRHNFRVNLAIGLNLLGVPQKDAEKWILQKYAPAEGYLSNNEVRFPYKNYKDAFGIWKYRLNPINVNIAHSLSLKDGERVSDHAENLVNLILSIKKVDLESGMNTGKTFAAIKVIAPLLKEKTGFKTVIICSLNDKAAKDSDQYAIPYLTGQRLKEAGQSAPDVWKEALKADVILVNQNTFPKLVQRLKSRKEGFHVFLDESHTLVSDYRQPNTLEVWKSFDKAETVTLLSATPKPYFSAPGLDFQRVTIHRENNPDIFMNVCEYAGKAKDVALWHINQTDFSDTRLVLKIQSKASIKALLKHLLSSGFGSDEIVCLYSESDIKQTEAYKRFIKAKDGQSSFAETVKVVLCTSAINEGIDIYETSGFQVQFVEVHKKSNFSIDDSVQFFGRLRDNNPKYFFSYHKKPREPWKQNQFNPLQEFLETISVFQAMADDLNKKANKFQGCYTLQQIFKTKTAFSNSESYLTKDEHGMLIPDVLAIASAVDKCSVSFTGTKQGWKQIQERHKFFKVTFSELTVQEDGKLKKAEKEVKAEKKAAERELIRIFDQEPDVLLQAVGQITEDAEIKKATKFQESRKEDVKRLQSGFPVLFSEQLSTAEDLAKSFFKFTKAGFCIDAFKNLFFTPEGFTSRQKMTYFLNALRIHLLLFLFEATSNSYKKGKQLPVLTVQQVEDAKAFLAFRNEVQRVSGSQAVITGRQALRALQSAYKGKRRDLTERKAVLLLSVLFDYNTITGDVTMFDLLKVRSLEDVLFVDGKLQVDQVNNYTSKLHNLLKDKQLIGNFMNEFF